MSDSHVILCCNVFRKELETLNISQSYPHVKVIYYPSRCGHPPVSCKEFLSESTEYGNINILCGNCCISDSNAGSILKPFHVHGLWQCFYMIANPAIVDHYAAKGMYIVTPGWLSSWRMFIKMWGFDRETSQQYFSESSTGVLLLDTGIDEYVSNNLMEFCEYIDRPYEMLSVGLGYLSLFITNLILQWQVKKIPQADKDEMKTKQKLLSNYAMALDLLRSITTVKNINDVTGQIVEMFSILFAPGKISFQLKESSAENRIIRQDKGFILPIPYDSRVLGTIEFVDIQFPQHIEDYISLASTMADICGMAINNALQYQKIEEFAYSDGLTHIANRRKFDDSLLIEWKRMAREQRYLSVILCDIDFFKLYNDKYGHLSGDRCLCQVAQMLSSHCRRPGDIVARYGGEEFVLLLSDTNGEDAFFIAERIRQSIEGLCIPHDDSLIASYVTLSLGISSCIPVYNYKPLILVRTADEALYEAKSAGRNRTKSKPLRDIRTDDGKNQH